MEINYVSLIKERNPEAYKDTVLGRKVTVHGEIGVFFRSAKTAADHQLEFFLDERGGVMLLLME